MDLGDYFDAGNVMGSVEVDDMPQDTSINDVLHHLWRFLMNFQDMSHHALVFRPEACETN